MSELQQEELSNTENVLVNWYEEAKVSSSNLSLRPVIYRRHVDGIYQTLIDLFEIDFFEINAIDALNANKLHLIHSLLMNGNKAHYYKLVEFCMLVEKAKRNETHWLKLQSVRFNSEELRDVMFELYMATLFEVNKIEYQTDSIRNNQILEGYCKIANKWFLYECKRGRSVIADNLKKKTFIFSKMLDFIKNQLYGMEFIITLKIKKDFTQFSLVHPILKTIKRYFKTRETDTEVDFQNEYLKVEIIPLTPANEIEITKNLRPIDGYITAKATGRIVEDNKEVFNTKAVYSHGHDKASSIKKFFKILHDAKRQHKSESNAGRIFVFENEHIGDTSAPLLRPDIFYEQEIAAGLNKKENQDIVVIIFKNYTRSRPLFSVLVYGPEKYSDQINLIRIFNYSIIEWKAIFQN